MEVLHLFIDQAVKVKNKQDKTTTRYGCMYVKRNYHYMCQQHRTCGLSTCVWLHWPANTSHDQGPISSSELLTLVEDEIIQAGDVEHVQLGLQDLCRDLRHCAELVGSTALLLQLLR